MRKNTTPLFVHANSSYPLSNPHQPLNTFTENGMDFFILELFAVSLQSVKLFEIETPAFIPIPEKQRYVIPVELVVSEEKLPDPTIRCMLMHSL